jgi:hypothetical protein
VVRVSASKAAQVQGEPRLAHECGKELLGKLRFEVADSLGRSAYSVAKIRPARNVNGGKDESLIHGQNYISVAADTAHISERSAKRLAKTYSHVLDGVVRVDLNIAVALDGKVKAAVTGKKREHMVKEATARAYLAFSASVKAERKRNIGFGGLAVYFMTSNHFLSPMIFSISRTSVAISSGVPIDILL